jgi:tRNA-binding EMAP/Myf-like protein
LPVIIEIREVKIVVSEGSLCSARQSNRGINSASETLRTSSSSNKNPHNSNQNQPLNQAIYQPRNPLTSQPQNNVTPQHQLQNSVISRENRNQGQRSQDNQSIRVLNSNIQTSNSTSCSNEYLNALSPYQSINTSNQ